MNPRKILLLSLIIPLLVQAQITYDGPAAGSVNSGVTVNTEQFDGSAKTHRDRFKLFNKLGKMKNYLSRDYFLDNNTINYITDPGSMGKNPSDSILIIRNFEGIPQTNSIPPDPYIAAGTNHIMQVVNSDFRISDKNGNTLRTIASDSWFSSALLNADPFDPKVIFDPFASRWVMVWLHLDVINTQSYYLISVSDDEDPIGEWFNWAIPGNVNGNTIDGHWADYEGIGFDDKAIYLTSDQFTYVPDIFKYERIKIIDKNYLYINDSPGLVEWTDIWNITYPETGSTPYMLRPARMYTSSSEYYFLVTDPDTIDLPKSSVGLYKLTNPLSNPVLTGVKIPVDSYVDPPFADQLGGGSPRLQIWGSYFMNEPVFMNGILHATHTVGTGELSSVKYIALDPDLNTVLKDFTMGTDEHYHFYTALAVNIDNDVIITYSRSSTNEYAGAFFTIVPDYSPAPLGSIGLMEGKGNYVKTFGSGLNRWGDYMGAALDPVDGETFWISAEYAAAPNTWGVRNGSVRSRLYDDAAVYTSEDEIDFSFEEIRSQSPEKYFAIKNYGSEDLIINSIISFNGDFILRPSNSTSIPSSLVPYDSLIMEVTFTPSQLGEILDSIRIITNSSIDPIKFIRLKGIGYDIAPVADYKLYASVNKINNELIEIDPANLQPTLIGNSTFPNVHGIGINPRNRHIYGLLDNANGSGVCRITANTGEVFPLFETDYIIDALVFDGSGNLYLISEEQKIYHVNLETREPAEVSDSQIRLSAIAFDHASGDFFAFSGIANDYKLYRTDLISGIFSEVGESGLSRKPVALSFDSGGNLFGIILKSFNSSYLISADKSTGSAIEIGRIEGYNNIRGLAFSLDSATSVKTTETNPSHFILYQNYPNPFNPKTTIKFFLPVNSHVNLSVHNILGETIVQLIDADLNAGTHSIEWDLSVDGRKTLSSGIYFYRMKAAGINGDKFSGTKKIMLIK